MNRLVTVLTVLVSMMTLASCSAAADFQQNQTQLETHAQQWRSLEYQGTPSPRHEAAFVEYQGKFYALGGRRIQSVDVYDPQTSQWHQGTPPPFQIHHVQPVIYQDKIVFAGAMTGGYPTEPPVKNLMYYLPLQDRWEVGPAIPTNRLRGGAGAVILGDQLYLVSGIQNGHTDGHVPWLDRYDFVSDQWTVLADAPRSRDHFQAAFINGKIYALGGRRTSKATGQVFSLTVPEVDVYDIQSDNWKTLPRHQNIPTPRAGSMSLTVEPYIVVVGGETQRATPAHNEVEAFNVRTEQWYSWPNLVEGRHGSGVILHQGKLWTGLGSGARGGKPELTTLEALELPAIPLD
ncbi:Kelch repeat-containing protein [Echinimonas agarilytica]|uniref:N-acetylneuraminic acid mutarotase n=1 Tax=Echinimonas agarilytica TaxID=1215918 RepID=A0AA41W7M3_9GAMM|nr:kelch repeat-containing protein [Echinimonas agarilytica]MCM2679878.1 hypothetical protein [Echinimonas agarilytica]